MNIIYKTILKIMASPKISIKSDYKWIRKVQNLVNSIPINPYQVMERVILSKDEDHEIPVRIFKPKEQISDEVILFFHGGGWVIGNIDSYSFVCMNLANETGRKVLSVDYRLAPENPYPAGLEDCLRVTEVLCNYSETFLKIPYEKIILMGDSAGGNLAAAVSLILGSKNKKRPLKQVLLYPVTWWDHTTNSPFPSIKINGYDYGLTSKNVQDYMELYCPDVKKRKSPTIAPLLAKDLSHQPETFLFSAQYDPLRDEGEAYAQRLAEAGVPTKLYRMENAAHGFFTLPIASPFVKTFYDHVNRFLNN